MEHSTPRPLHQGCGTQPLPALVSQEGVERTLATFLAALAAQEGVERTLAAFLDARSHVGPHLYEDVRRAVGRLRAAGVLVGALTNGNCDVSRDAGVRRTDRPTGPAPTTGQRGPLPVTRATPRLA